MIQTIFNWELRLRKPYAYPGKRNSDDSISRMKLASKVKSLMRKLVKIVDLAIFLSIIYRYGRMKSRALLVELRRQRLFIFSCN